MRFNVSIGPFGAFALVFILLKLFHLISCPWKFVFLPVWVALGIPLVFFICLISLLIFAKIIEDWKQLVEYIVEKIKYGR